MQTGFYAARRIKHEVERRAGQQKPFRYHDLGSAAYISRGRAVVSVKRFHASGFIGWLAWLGIHIAFLTSFRNRISARADAGPSRSAGSRVGSARSR